MHQRENLFFFKYKKPQNDLYICPSLSAWFRRPAASPCTNKDRPLRIWLIRPTTSALRKPSKQKQLFTFYQDFQSLGNQHGTKPNCSRQNWDASTVSPTLFTYRRRRRRELTAGTQQAPLKENEPIKRHRTSSSIFGEHLLAEKRISSQMYKPVCRMKRTDDSPVRSLSKKSHSPFRKDSFATEDSDFQDYDNEMFSIFNATRHKHETVDVKSAQEAAAQRVRTKIQEVEGILRRIVVTSSEWTREDGDGRDEVTLAPARTLQKTQRKLNSQSRLESRSVMVDSLSQSLHQVLKMEEVSYPHYFICAAPSPNCLSGRAEVSSPPLSEASSQETLSPILSCRLLSHPGCPSRFISKTPELQAPTASGLRERLDVCSRDRRL